MEASASCMVRECISMSMTGVPSVHFANALLVA
jgi:hypothetical protein